jgi:hypothetical protein
MNIRGSRSKNIINLQNDKVIILRNKETGELYNAYMNCFGKIYWNDQEQEDFVFLDENKYCKYEWAEC